MIDLTDKHYQQYGSFYCNELMTNNQTNHTCANGGIWNMNEQRCICDPYSPYFTGPSCFVYVCLNGGTLMANDQQQYCRCPYGVTGRFCESGTIVIKISFTLFFRYMSYKK